MQQLENWFVSYGQSVWGQILLFNITAHSFIAGRGRILRTEMCCIPCSDAYCSHPQDCRDSQYPQELLSLQIITIHSFPCVWEFYTPKTILTWSVAIKFLKLETWHTCCRQMLTHTCPGATYTHIHKTSVQEISLVKPCISFCKYVWLCGQIYICWHEIHDQSQQIYRQYHDMIGKDCSCHDDFVEWKSELSLRISSQPLPGSSTAVIWHQWSSCITSWCLSLHSCAMKCSAMFRKQDSNTESTTFYRTTSIIWKNSF